MGEEFEITPDQAALVQAAIENFGLGSLWQVVYGYLENGYADADTIMTQIELDPAYQQEYYRRFPAVEQLRKENQKRANQGLPLLKVPTASEYVTLERSYQEVTKDLPGNWGSNENITQWISKNISPEQIDDRITTAEKYINYEGNAEVRAQLRDIYGLTDLEMVEYVLSDSTNQQRLTSQWEQRERSAFAGAAAKGQGVRLSDEMRAQIGTDADQSYTLGQASAIFSNVAAQAESYKRLGDISGEKTNTDELIVEGFGLAGSGQVSKKMKRLASQERARFSGSSGLRQGSLGSSGLGSR